MAKRARSLVLLSGAMAAAMAVAVAASRSAAAGLTVHEWGTFTSVAGPDGQSVNWTPLSGPQDLPCFVDRQRPDSPQGLTSIQVKGRDIFGLLKILPGFQPGPNSAVAAAPAPRPTAPTLPPPVMVAKVRMETPVLYFYSPDRVTVDVKVSFNQGVMSEWYPHAEVPSVNLSRPLATTVGTIGWPAVNVLPNANVTYPQDAVKSHYYAARQVDASPLEVGTQHEKFLFYRGLADFQPPLAATIGRDGDVTAVASVGTTRAVLFENRHGRVAYRLARGVGSRLTLSHPVAGTIDQLRVDLEAMLTAEGLYAREANAMVETWRDSWFEEGARIFYIIPRAAIDARLPLTISPAPASVARVFVGRLELITSEMKDDVERAILANDLDALNQYGRFLDTIALQIADRPSLSANPARVEGALRAVALSHPHPTACQ
jgi:hypothetical protein